MLASLGINPDQIYGDVYNAWLRDTHEKNSPESKLFFRDMIESGFLERQIILRRQRLGVNVINSLATALHRSPLTKLDLYGNALRDTGVEVLAHLMRDLPQLTYLNLGANDIGSQGIQSLSFVIAQHRKLSTLLLGSPRSDPYANHITPVSATILLEGCLRNRSIRHLDLSGSAFGVEMPSLLRRNGDDEVSTSTVGGGTVVVGGDARNAVNGLRNQNGYSPSPLRSRSESKKNGEVGVGGTREASASAPGSAGGGSPLTRSDEPRRPMDLLEQLIRSSATLTTLRIKEIDLSPRGALALIYALRDNSTLLLLDISHNHLPPSVGDALGHLLLDRGQLKNKCQVRTLLLNGNELFLPTDMSTFGDQKPTRLPEVVESKSSYIAFQERNPSTSGGAVLNGVEGEKNAGASCPASWPGSQQAHAKEQKKTLASQRRVSRNVLINGKHEANPTTATIGLGGGRPDASGDREAAAKRRGVDSSTANDGEEEEEEGVNGFEDDASREQGKARRSHSLSGVPVEETAAPRSLQYAINSEEGKAGKEEGESSGMVAPPFVPPSLAQSPLYSLTPLLFSTLANDRYLTTLALAHCGIDDGAVYTLCRAIFSNLTLQYLSLEDNDISADGAVMLGRALCHHASLRHLRLSSNCIEDEGGCAMASMLLGNPSLTVLDLRCTWLGDRGLIALGHALHSNHSVRAIYLGDNHFTEHGGASFAAFLEKNDTVVKCELGATSVPHHTILRLEQCLKRNAKRLANAEPDALKKELVRLHFQKYKLEESRNELENLREKNAEVKRHAENVDLQAKQDLSDFVKRIRELEEQIENYTKQEERYRQQRQKLEMDLEKEKSIFVEDMEVAKERLQTEVKAREKVEEEYRQVEAELADWKNNGPEREVKKIQNLKQIREDMEQWSNQRKAYQQRALQLNQELSELSAQLKREGKGIKKGKGGKGKKPKKGK